MAQPNFKNRTLWTGDNLDIMRGLNSETVDENLQLLCGHCNSVKGNKTQEEFLAALRSR